MDVQKACLSKIVREGELLPFVDAKITKDFFPEASALKVWNLVIEHYQKYGKPPSEEAVHRAYPTYDFDDFPEPVEFYLNQLQQDRKKVILVNSLQDAASRIQDEDGPSIGDDLENIIRQGLADAAHEVSQGRDSDFYLSQDRIIERLRERKENPGLLRGITTGVTGIDNLTGGLQPEQLITFIGTPKAGKSSILLKMAYTAHRNGHRVLFVTFEMGTVEQEDRMVSLLSGVGLTKVLTGTFSVAEQEKIHKALDLRKNRDGFIITSDIRSATTVSGIQAKIQQYNPDLIIIDGVYLMDDEAGHDKGTPQALTSITRSLKRLAQNHRRPIVISTQAMIQRSRGGLTMASIGYSSSFAQDSDIIFGVEAHEQVYDISKFKVIASRSSGKGEAYVHFDWGQGVIEELSAEDYEMAINNAMPTASSRTITSSGKKSRSTLQEAWGADDGGT